MKLELNSETNAQWQITIGVSWLQGWGPLFTLLGAVLLWLFSIRGLDVRQMNDLGLVSILPPTTYLALVLVTVSFFWSLTQTRSQTPLLTCHVLVLIFMLFGITALLEEEARFPVTWQHFGFTEYIVRTGTLAQGIDARFSWPGFFALNAFLTEIIGDGGIRLLAAWAAPLFNLLYFAPLVSIMNSATTDRRLAWLSIWFFYITNWVGQDYFAPQAFNFFIYLVILAILLRWFKVEQPGIAWLEHAPGPWGQRLQRWLAQPAANAVLDRRQQSGMIALIIVLFAVVVSSHQLTPFVALASVSALVLFNRSQLRGLPLIMGVMIAAWLGYMTADFLSGHLRSLLNDVGRFGTSVSENVAERVNGSPLHAVIVYMRLFITLCVWVLALLGALRRLWHGRCDLTYLLLALAPFTVLGLQSYGGEVLIRVYLFNLPFMAFAGAGLFYPALSAGTGWRGLLAPLLVSIFLLSGFQFTRYGNERMDFVTHKDIAGLDYLYQIAPPESRFVTISPYIPWAYRDVERYSYIPNRGEFALFDVPRILELMSVDDVPQVFLVLTRNQKSYGELFYGLPMGWGEQLEEELLATKKFAIVFDNGDVKIFTLANRSPKGDTP